MTSLHRDAMIVLLGDIVSGAIGEGEKLASLTELARQFGVSTSVIRECQRALEERGMVAIHHWRRAVVRSEEEWDVLDPDVLTALLAGSGAPHVLAEYLESRRILEVEASGLAAERATPASLRELSRCLEAMNAAADRARRNSAAEPLYRSADIEFHRAIIRAAGNRPLARMAEPIHRALTAAFGALARPERRFERSLPEHRRIFAAIEARDQEAAREAMREHLLTVEGYLRERAAAPS